jgi:hypothetical protein
MWGRAALTLFGLVLGACAGRSAHVPARAPAASLVAGAATDSALRARGEAPVRLRGVTIAARARVEREDRAGESNPLPRDREILGMRLPRGTEVRFEDGVPARLLHPSAPLVVGGLTGAPGAPISLHSDGSVEEICLAREANLGELVFPPGTSLYFDEEGFAAILDQPTYFPTGRFVSIVPTAHADCRPRREDARIAATLERMAEQATRRAMALEQCRPLVASGPPRPVVITARLDERGALDGLETPPELPAPASACAEEALRDLALEGRSRDGFTVSILWYLGACRSPDECHEAYVRSLLEGP